MDVIAVMAVMTIMVVMAIIGVMAIRAVNAVMALMAATYIVFASLDYWLWLLVWLMTYTDCNELMNVMV